MKPILMLPLLFAILAGCQTQETRMLTGAALGMAAGAAVASKEDRTKGALIGGAVGLVAATYLGHNSAGQCVYQRPDGSRYSSTC